MRDGAAVTSMSTITAATVCDAHAAMRSPSRCCTASCMRTITRPRTTARISTRHGVLAVNLMSSPGSGKTALLEATIEALGDRYRIAVIEGDLETENDAARIRAKGVPAVQITTGQTCHLDAHMVHDALHALDLDGDRHPVHRECRQSRLPGRLRSRASTPMSRCSR